MSNNPAMMANLLNLSRLTGNDQKQANTSLITKEVALAENLRPAVKLAIEKHIDLRNWKYCTLMAPRLMTHLI